MAERKDAFIIIRIEKKLKRKLVEMAGGARKLSIFIRKILEEKI